jgi:hypothetical protein
MTENSKVDILRIIAEDRSLTLYRGSLNKITGGVTSTILLQQALYWWEKNGRKRFYKFRDKCNHALYVEGDSWCEELYFTMREFDTAIKKIGFKLGKTDNSIKKEEAFIIYFRDSQGVTWYDINANYLEERLTRIYLVNDKSAFTKKITNPHLVTKTETNPYIKTSYSKYGSKNNKDNSEEDYDGLYQRYIPKKDIYTPEERKRVNQRIAKLARVALEGLRGPPNRLQVASS